MTHTLLTTLLLAPLAAATRCTSSGLGTSGRWASETSRSTLRSATQFRRLPERLRELSTSVCRHASLYRLLLLAVVVVCSSCAEGPPQPVPSTAAQTFRDQATSPPSEKPSPSLAQQQREPPQTPLSFCGGQAGDSQTVTVNGQAFALRWCPPGRFRMGSPPSETGRDEDEAQVEIDIESGYWLGETEVTQAQWQTVTGATLRQHLATLIANSVNGEGPEYPMHSVSREEATGFCRRLTELLRKSGVLPDGAEVVLPTEAQWEYGCRAGTTTRFCCGDHEAALGDYAWYGKNSGYAAHAVGQKKPNAWGLYDVHGNVAEWCRDSHEDQRPSRVDAHPQARRSRNGTVRGGSWGDDADDCRSADRIAWGAAIHSTAHGFRLAVVCSVR